MNLPLKSTLLAVAAAGLMTFSSAAAEADQTTRDTFKTLMDATVADDLAGFTSVCDDTMKAAITAPTLDGVSKQIAPRAKDGYDSEYLGELNQHGFAVHLWRLRFKSGGDDILATLSVKDGKVGGFYLH